MTTSLKNQQIAAVDAPLPRKRKKCSISGELWIRIFLCFSSLLRVVSGACVVGDQTVTYSNVNLHIRQEAQASIPKPVWQWSISNGSDCTNASEDLQIINKDGNVEPEFDDDWNGVQLGQDYATTLPTFENVNLSPFTIEYTMEQPLVSGSQVTASDQFTVTIVDDCSSLTESQITGTISALDMEQTVLDTATYKSIGGQFGVQVPDGKFHAQNFQTVTFSISVTDYVSTAVYDTVCGNIVYELETDPLFRAGRTPITMDASSNQITVNAVRNEDVASTDDLATLQAKEDYEGYTLNFRILFFDTDGTTPMKDPATGIDYPSVLQTTNLKVKILPCAFDPATHEVVDDTVYTYEVLSPTRLEIDLNLTPYTNDCFLDYEKTFQVSSISPEPSSEASNFISFEGNYLVVSSQEPQDAGTYTVTLDITFSGYPTMYHDPSGENASGEITLQYVISSLTITDPCSDTDLIKGFEIEHLHALIGQPSRTIEYADFMDTASMDRDSELHTWELPIGGYNLCGARSHIFEEVIRDHSGAISERVDQEELNFVSLSTEQTTLYLTYGSSRGVDAGIHELQLTVKLLNYTTSVVQDVVSTVNVTLYKIETDLQMADETYFLNTGPMEIEVPELQFSPHLHETTQNGDQIIQKAFLKVSDSQYDPLPMELGILDATNRKLIIDTAEFDYIGFKKIKLTFTGQDYLEGQTFSTEFGLINLPSPLENQYSIQSKPTLGEGEEEKTLAFNVTVGESWTYTLPQGVQNLDIPVIYYSVDLGKASTFLSYDLESQVLSIQKGATGQATIDSYSIELQLIDAYGVLSEIYTLTLNIGVPEVDDLAMEQFEGFVPELNLGAFYASLLQGALAFKEINPKLQPPIPSASIEQVSATGKLKINFSTPMTVFDVVKTMNQDGIVIHEEVRILSSEVEEKSSTIAASATQERRQKHNSFEIKMIPGGFSEAKDLDFSWQVTDYTSQSLEIQLDYAKPLVVSSTPEPDEIEVSFRQHDDSILMFVDHYGQPIPTDSLLVRAVPQQFVDKDLAESLAAAQDNLGKSTQGIFAANVIVSFALSASLQYLWEMINAQQIVILLPLFKVQIPTSSSFVFNALMFISAFEIFPTDAIYAKWSDVEGRPLNLNFERIGFEHHLLLNNFGSLGFTLIVIFPLLYVVYFFLLKCRCTDRTRRWQLNLRKHLFWNALLRMTIESYIIGLICCLLNLRNIDFSDESDDWTKANSIITYIVLVYFILFPIVAIYKMYTQFGQLRTVPIRSRYGEIYEGYNIDDRKMLILWGFQELRKVFLCCAVVLAQDYFFVQMQALYMGSVALIITMGHIKGRQQSFDNKMNIFNEVKLILIMYHMMLFTMFVPQPEIKYKLGFSCATTVLAGLAVNMIMVVLQPIVLIRKGIRLKIFKARAKKDLQELRLKRIGRQFGKRCVERRAKEQAQYAALLKDLKGAGIEHFSLAAQFKEEKRLKELHDARVQNTKKRHERKLHHQELNQRRLYDPDYESEKEEAPNTTQAISTRQTVFKLQNIPVNIRRPKITDKLNEQASGVDQVFDDGVLYEEDKVCETAVGGLHTDSSLVDEGFVRLQRQQIQKFSSEAVRQKLTWKDLNDLQESRGLTISDIEKIPGYENFEITEEEKLPTGALPKFVNSNSATEKRQMQTALTSLKKKMTGETTTMTMMSNKVTPINGIELGIDVDQLMRENQREIDAFKGDQPKRYPLKQHSNGMSHLDSVNVSSGKDRKNLSNSKNQDHDQELELEFELV